MRSASPPPQPRTSPPQIGAPPSTKAPVPRAAAKRAQPRGLKKPVPKALSHNVDDAPPLNDFEADLIAKARAGASTNFSRARSPPRHDAAKPPDARPITPPGAGGSPPDEGQPWSPSPKPPKSPKPQQRRMPGGSGGSRAKPKVQRGGANSEDPADGAAASRTVRRGRLGSLEGARGGGSVRSTGTKGGDDMAGYLVGLELLEPYPTPGTGLKHAFAAIKKGLEQETWIEACEGLSIIRRLLRHHPEVLAASMHSTAEAAFGEVKNLRSQVSRVAILLLADLCEELPKPMEKELDACITCLLRKVGAEGASTFIRADIDDSFARIIAVMAPARCVGPFAAGVEHKSPFVHKVVAEQMFPIIGRFGQRLVGSKEAPKLLSAMARLAEEKDATTRYLSRKCFSALLGLQGIEAEMRKSLPDALLRSAEAVVAKLRQNGLGDPPGSGKPRLAASAGSRSGDPGGGGGSGSARAGRSGSMGRSAGKGRSMGAGRSAGASPRRPLSTRSIEPALPAEKLEALDDVLQRLGSANWQEREQAIGDMQAMALRETGRMNKYTTRIFDAYSARLADSNSRVNRAALEAFRRFAPAFRDGFEANIPAVVQLVNKLAGNLASKNVSIREESSGALTEMGVLVDASALLQPYATAASYGVGKVKEAMVAQVCQLVENLGEAPQKQLKKHVMPLLGQLLGDKKSRVECGSLCEALVGRFGRDATLQLASGLPPDKQALLGAAL